MIEERLEDIPRLLTALTEWGAAAVYVSLIPKRLRRAPLILVLALGLPAIIGIELVAGSLPLGFWPLGRLIAALAMYVLIWACTSTTWKTSGELVARAWILAELVASLEWQLDQGFYSGEGWGAARVALVVVTFGSAFGAAWLLERRNFPRGRSLVSDGRTVIAALAIALVVFAMSNLSFITANTPFSGRTDREVFYIRTLVDFAGFIAFYAIRSQRLQLERALEVQSMSALLRTQHEQYVRSRHLMDLVNSRYHDLKHYVTAIRAEPDAAVRSAIVDELEASIQGYASAAVETGNPVVDAILGAETARAESAGITVTSVVDGKALDSLDVIDVVSIMGNALDNAIDASSRVASAEQRLIRVAVFRQDHFAILRFENYFGGQLEFVEGLPRTTKAEPIHHGYGLKNIRAAAEKYGGSVTVRVEEGWFVLRVLVPLASDPA